MMYPLTYVPESFVATAPWIFTSHVDLPVSSEQALAILMNDEYYPQWHPEVTNVHYLTDANRRGKGTRRRMTFSDALFNLFLWGPTTVEEVFDVWEIAGRIKRLGFYMTGTSKPTWLTYTALREEFTIRPKETDQQECTLTRIVAVQPSFVLRYVLGWLAHPHLTRIFVQKCPQRLLRAIQEKRIS